MMPGEGWRGGQQKPGIAHRDFPETAKISWRSIKKSAILPANLQKMPLKKTDHDDRGFLPMKEPRRRPENDSQKNKSMLQDDASRPDQGSENGGDL